MYISTIKKIAAETDTAEIKKLVITVALRGAKRPKLTKRAVSQKISTIRRDKDIEVAACSYINQRVCMRSNAIFNARACSERCASSFGVSVCILSKRDSAPATCGSSREVSLGFFD